MQAAIELAVCLSEYKQLKLLTASTLVMLLLLDDTFSYYPKHTHTHTHTHIPSAFAKKFSKEGKMDAYMRHENKFN